MLDLCQRTASLEVYPHEFRKFAKEFKHEVAGKVATRRDAELMLHITSAILRYFGMVMAEKRQ